MLRCIFMMKQPQFVLPQLVAFHALNKACAIRFPSRLACLALWQELGVEDTLTLKNVINMTLTVLPQTSDVGDFH